MTRTVLKNRRSRASCSIIALATVLVVGASPAAAQSFIGNGTFTDPTKGSINQAVAGQTTVTLNSGVTQAVINWSATGTPSGGQVVFQNSGTTATFTGSTDFAVLNNISTLDPTNVIVMNGTVNTRVSGAQRGSVYFYTPGGFIFGGTSTFSVGSLVASTLPIAFSGSTFITGAQNTVTFNQATQTGSTITMSGTVNANYQPLGVGGTTTASYVALVAPHVIHNGTITVNGSAALVAAEAATINFSPDGLFDISVTVGTTDSQGIGVSGDITGPTPASATDNQRIYLIAVPKNQALTMALTNGSDLGFTLAGGAYNDKGVVVLSAGHDILDGNIDVRSSGHGSGTASIAASGIHATNNVVADATGNAEFYSTAGALSSVFDNNLSAHADGHVWMNASGAGTSLSVAGNVSLSASETGASGQSVTGGDVALYAQNGGVVTVGGSTTLTSNAVGGNASSGSAGNGTGGTVTVSTASGGSLSLHALSASASGTGGNGTAAGVNAGNGTGGILSIVADTGSSILVNGATNFTAQGTGGSSTTGLAGNGAGGTARAYVGDNSTLTFNNNLSFNTDGLGGSTSGSGKGGNGTGGSSRITSVTNSIGTGVLTVNGSANLFANGTGGNSAGGDGGDGTGGSAYMYATANHYVINGNTWFDANGEGGSGALAGGTGQGGLVQIVSAGSEVDISGSASLDAEGYGGGGNTVGGDGFGGSIDITSTNDVSILGNVYAFADAEGAQGGDGGYGEGGVITVKADGGNLSLGNLLAVSYGEGGDANTGFGSGSGQGGSIYVKALNGGSLAVTNDIDAIAEAYAGRTDSGNNDGSGFGGYVEVSANGAGSQITVGSDVSLNALAYGQYSGCFSCGGAGAIAGDAYGGTINLAADGGDITISGNVLAEADALGGEFDTAGGTTGDGYGGDITVRASSGGSLDVNGALTATAKGRGGFTYALGVNGGDGYGGTINVNSTGTNSALDIAGNVALNADGSAGSGGECIICGGLGGDGFGGVIHIGADGTGASIDVGGQLSAFAEGFGGTGVDADGGFGKGGEVKLSAGNGASLNIDGFVDLSADGYGGWRDDGGYGGDLAAAGDGQGGFVEVFTWGTSGSILTLGDNMDATADGYGGSNSVATTTVTGGDGLGGTAWLDAQTGTINIAGTASVAARGYGGDAQFGTGGAGIGKNAEIDGIGGSVVIGGSAYVDVNGYGGNGVTGGNGTGGGQVFEDGSTIDSAIIWAANGTVSIGGNASVTSSGFGGDGANGGNGGDGTGGHARIQATNRNAGASSITINGVGTTTYVAAEGHGGGGGQGTSGNTGGDGGIGGDGTGGIAYLLGSAGNGTVTIRSASLSAQAFGGDGGNGGNGDGGAGGSGGDGGNATGGVVNVGTGSGNQQALGSNLGSGNYGSIYADASATGGRGGDGNFGATGGNGGDGGDAINGFASLLVRGSVVNVTSANLVSNATGGDAGFGYFMEGGTSGTTGIGGDATIGGFGGVGVLVTNRFLNTSQRGTLNAGSITGSATATGGIGIPDGQSISLGGSQVTFSNSDGTIGSLDFTTSLAGNNQSTSGRDFISITGGTVGATNFSFDAVGNLSLFVDNATFNVGTLNLTADNFIYDGRAWTNTGQINASTVNVDTNEDFVADGNWDVTNTFVVDAPGLIELDSVHDDAGVDFSAGGSINITGAFSAGTFVDLFAGGDIDTGDISAGTFIVEHSTGGSIDVGNITAGGAVSLIADTFIHGEDITTPGNIFAQTNIGDISLEQLTSNAGDVTLWAGNDLFLVAADNPVTDGDIVADGDITLNAGGLIDMNDASGGYFEAHAGSTFDSLNLTSDADIRIEAGDDVTVGHLVAGLPVSSSKAIRIISDGSVSLIDINSLGGIDITAAGNVTGGAVTTGDGLFTDAVGSITYGNISAGLVNPQTPSEILSVALAAGTSINVGNVDTAIGAAFISPGTVTTGDIDGGTGDVLGLVHGNISMGDISGNRIYLADYSMYTDIGGTIPTSDSVDPSAIEGIFTTTPVKTGGSITVGDINAASFTAAAGTNLTVGILNVDGGLTIDAGAAITTGNLTVGDFVLANGGSITTGDIDSFSVDMTSTAGNITTGDVFATGGVSLDAFGDISTGDITAGSIDLVAGDDITTGDLTTQQLLLFSVAEGPISTLSFPGASISLDAAGDISTGAIDSIDGVWANAGGTITTGTIDAVDFVDLSAVGNILTDDIAAGGYVDIISDTGSITTGNLSGDSINLDAAGTITFDDVNGYDFDFDAGGNVNGGNITVDDRVSGGSGANIVLGNINAGPIVPFNDFSVGIGAVGNITVGNVTGAGPVGFASSGNLTTGNLSGGELVMLLVGGNVTTGSITTGFAPGSEVYIGDDSIFFANGGTINGDGDFDPIAALAQFPAATGGSITINGDVTTGAFRAAAGTSLTTQGITAASIEARAGGLATINGVWNASNDAELRSNDIDITGTGRINAGGYLTLASTNPTQIVIGDGVTTSGYLLSNAEFGRLSGEQVRIVGRGDASATIDMVIGNLTVDNPTTGSTLNDPNGALVFAVGNIDTLTPSGTIRVVGDIVANDFGLGNSMEFYASRFELDAAIGSISITSDGTNLSGELGLYADQIRVAEATILDKLAANPTYLNYQDDLNKTPTTFSHPEGVLRADTLWIESDNLQDVLIQNTGTGGQGGTPAGFLVRQAFINDDFNTAGPAGSINLIVNGQVVTEGGTLTGVAARDALVPTGTDITPFTGNSTINGCPLTGECILRPPAPPPQANIVDSQIDLISGDSLGDSEFGNEDSIDDNSEGDEGADNPITPPQPLFDTRPLIPSGDIDDPVSGTGNPALIGGDEECEGGENGQCPANGDGQ